MNGKIVGTRIQLPKPMTSCNYGSNDVKLSLNFTAPRNATWENGTVSLVIFVTDLFIQP